MRCWKLHENSWLVVLDKVVYNVVYPANQILTCNKIILTRKVGLQFAPTLPTCILIHNTYKIVWYYDNTKSNILICILSSFIKYYNIIHGYDCLILYTYLHQVKLKFNVRVSLTLSFDVCEFLWRPRMRQDSCISSSSSWEPLGF